MDSGIVRAAVAIDSEPASLPKRIRLRLPHPGGLRASAWSTGEYDRSSESVVLEGFSDSAAVELRF